MATIKTVRTVKTVRTREEKTVRTVKVVRTRNKRPGGVILYRGPSMLDGKPIVVIATFKTSNRKTGDVIQTWILCADVDPVTAVKTGRDGTICGGCPLRGLLARAGKKAVDGDMNRKGRRKHRACYVNVGQAPRQVYDGFTRGIYPMVTDAIMAKEIKGRGLRLGSYGDPVAAPAGVWEEFLEYGRKHGNGKHLGYTHQWRMPTAAPFRGFLMASTAGVSETLVAQEQGWRTYRVKRASDPLLPSEVACPASDEAGKKRDCNTCNLCSGYRRPGQKSAAINGHASKPILGNVNHMLNVLAN